MNFSEDRLFFKLPRIIKNFDKYWYWSISWLGYQVEFTKGEVK